MAGRIRYGFHEIVPRRSNWLLNACADRASSAKAIAHILPADTRNPNNFISTARAGRNGNGRSRDLQSFGDELDAGLVGPAFEWRRGHGQFHCVPHFAGDRILFRARMKPDRESYAVLAFVDPKHIYLATDTGAQDGRALMRSPKMPVPTRTQVEPSSIATSKSCDMPIDRTFIMMAGSLLSAIASRISRSFWKYGRAPSGSSVNGGTVISPRNCNASNRTAANSRSSMALEDGKTPLLAASPPTFTSMSTGSFLC